MSTEHGHRGEHAGHRGGHSNAHGLECQYSDSLWTCWESGFQTPEEVGTVGVEQMVVLETTVAA